MLHEAALETRRLHSDLIDPGPPMPTNRFAQVDIYLIAFSDVLDSKLLCVWSRFFGRVPGKRFVPKGPSDRSLAVYCLATSPSPSGRTPGHPFTFSTPHTRAYSRTRTKHPAASVPPPLILRLS
jgi:hypothetical protein